MRIKKGILVSFVIALLLMVVGTAAAQAPAEEWNKTFGGAYNDGAVSVRQLSDGGYITAGYYYQDSNYDSSDAWLIKNYADGTEEWNRTFGGSLHDSANSVQQTSDGGYILAGLTRSFGAVETDALLIKTDASGTEEWNRTFGGVAYDGFKSVQQTFNTTGDPDGYIIAGYVDNDAMLIKIYANGTEEWNKKFDSGSLSERAESVQQTADGGYILAGHTGSSNSDFWLIKTYADGTEEWNKRFDSGVFDNDYAYSVQQTSDGGYILAGSTGSYDSDFWLIKTYADGTEEWNKKFDSGSLFDCAESVQQTSDGGYILAGRTYSITNSNDAWMIKTYADGTEEWNMTFGGTGNDEALSVQQTSDSGYIIAGRTAANGSDAWLIKIAGTAVAVKAPAEEWNNTFDIGLHDYAWSVQQTSPDGGYILAGFTGSDNFDALLIKTDYNGNEMWNKTLGNASWDYAESVQQTSDGGYILAGTTLSDQGFDAWLIKTNEMGVEQWNNTFGGTGSDQASSVQQTSDGGYIFAGYTGVVDTGVKDVWLIKTNETGVEEWNKTFGDINDDSALSVQQTSDGGYILAGSKSTLAEDSDAWLIKTDRNGDLEWDMTFAGTTSNSEEEARSVQQTSDGGYILAGYTGPRYLPDAWLIKTNETGVEEWNKTFGTGYDNAYSVQQTSDGGYILAGSTMVDNVGSSGWLIKTDSAGIEEWNIKLNDGGATSVRQTLDGGYILAGIKGSQDSSDALLVKIAGTGQAVTTHYVGVEGGYATIQAAVDAASDGDTIIVYPETYTEDVLVNKSLTIMSQSGNPEDTIVQAAPYSAFWVVANNVTISGFKTISEYNGITVESCNNTILTDNIMEGYESPVSSGIVVQGSCNNTVLTNNSVMNNEVGIIVESCNNTILTDNMVEWNYGPGILVQSCNNTVLIDNAVEINEREGIMLYLSDNSILTDNTVNGNYNGIVLAFANNSILTSNIATNNKESGIILYMSNNNKLTSNTASDNYWGGIKLDFSSNNELISNTASNNYWGGGMQLDSSSNNELTDNTVTNNNQGIRMDNSDDNTLTSNIVSGNNYCGIWLDGDNNTVSSNNVSDNVDYGFQMSGSSNLIYNNRFNNSTFDFTMGGDSAGLNTLNSTEMLTYMYNGNKYTSYIGNNYSDYTGADSNGDGIGDTPRYEDSYPLMFWPVISSTTVGTDIIINDTTPYTIGVGDTLTIGVGDTLTIENGGTLTIEEGGTLTIEDGGYIDNGGRINNYGTIDNSGQIDNNNKDGEIYHDYGGTIDNYGEIYNTEVGTTDNDGWIDNYGTIENDGIIDNSGLIYNDYGGTICNDGEIYNNEDGTIDNYGELDNYGTINNKGFLYCDVGTIYNDYSGTIDNYGTIYNDYGAIENYGEIYNNEGCTLKNYGTIENYGDSIHNYGTIANAGTIDNYGTFANYAGGTIENAGIINIFSGTLTGEGSISGEGSINDYTTVKPVADAGGPYSAVEGSEIIFDASKSSDLDGDALQYRWDFESNGTWTAWSTEPTSTYTWNDDWEGMATVEVSDGKLNNNSTATVTVTSADPVVGTIVSPIDPYQVNTLVSVNGTFSDPGTEDTHTSVWNWGDGTTSAGTVSEAQGTGTVTGEHTYVSPGVYWVNLTITDDDGASASRVSEQYVVVYDPSGGFVTGAGWIYSPAGAYTDAPSLEGKATFGFVSKYEKKTADLTGNTEFEFKIADMKFKSTGYDWLVIAGSQAKYKGSGTINGAGDYVFMLSAVDGAVKGDGVDKFRIKIWDKASGEIVYDNEVGVSEDEEPSTAIGAGSIVIRKAK